MGFKNTEILYLLTNFKHDNIFYGKGNVMNNTELFLFVSELTAKFRYDLYMGFIPSVHKNNPSFYKKDKDYWVSDLYFDKIQKTVKKYGISLESYSTEGIIVPIRFITEILSITYNNLYIVSDNDLGYKLNHVKYGVGKDCIKMIHNIFDAYKIPIENDEKLQ